MLTYKGLGYTQAFVTTMSAALDRIMSGSRIILVSGPDDLCAALVPGCGHEGHCRDKQTFERDALATAAIGGLIPLQEGEPFSLSVERLQRLRDGFADGSLRAACSGCEWKPLCDGIAAAGFAESQLQPPSVAP